MNKDLKSLFITFPQRLFPDNFPPYGAMAVINSLHRAGYKNTSLYNLDVLRPAREEALEYIVSLNPGVLCISSPVSTGYANCKTFSLEIKKRLPGVIIILGGNLAASAEIILNKTGVDFCVLGEGEKVIIQLYDAILENRSSEKLRDIKGLAYLDGGHLVNTGYADLIPDNEIFNVNWDTLDQASVKHYFPVIKDLDTRSFPLRYFFADRNGSVSIDRDRVDKTIGVISCSKGCISRCTFCHRFNKGIRFVPIEIIIQRIKELIHRLNLGAIMFGDECFGANKKWLMRFCEAIKPLNLIWKVGGMRVDIVNPEIIRMMKDAGCRSIIYGMEAGSERILKVMEKGVVSEDNYNAMKWTVDAGLFTVPQLVVGMPGESPETIKETSDFVAYGMTLDKVQNPALVSINFAQALPGTPLYEYGRSTGRIGAALDTEEKYLFDISDRNASDEETALNFTEYPRLIQLSWRWLISYRVTAEYVKKFGIDHYCKKVFGDNNRPNALRMIIKRCLFAMYIVYPQTIYMLGHLICFIKLVKVIRNKGLPAGISLFKEYILFMVGRLRRHCAFEYKSLRKILENDVSNAYSGTKEAESLRRGR